MVNTKVINLMTGGLVFSLLTKREKLYIMTEEKTSSGLFKIKKLLQVANGITWNYNVLTIEDTKIHLFHITYAKFTLADPKG